MECKNHLSINSNFQQTPTITLTYHMHIVYKILERTVYSFQFNEHHGRRDNKTMYYVKNDVN